MTLYDEFQTVARDMLGGDFDQGTVHLLKVTPGTPGANEWEPVADSTSKYLLRSVSRDVEQKYVDGSSIRSSDLQCTASAVMTLVEVDDVEVTNEEKTPDVEVGDVLVVDGEGHKILRVIRVPRAGTCVVWKIFARLG